MWSYNVPKHSFRLQKNSRTVWVHKSVMLEWYYMHEASSMILQRIQLYTVYPSNFCLYVCNFSVILGQGSSIIHEQNINFSIQLWIVTVYRDIICMTPKTYWRWVQLTVIVVNHAVHLEESCNHRLHRASRKESGESENVQEIRRIHQCRGEVWYYSGPSAMFIADMAHDVVILDCSNVKT